MTMLQRRAAIFALVTVAEKALAREIDSIECAMQITRLLWNVDDPNRDLFLPFRGVASEADNAVVGDRTLWAQAFLDECDQRYKEVESHYRSMIDDSCAELIAEYRPKLCACPACGFVAAIPPYAADGTPSYTECACCAFMFVLELVDDNEFGIWRRRWIRAGMPFRGSPVPADFEPHAQMRAASLEDGLSGSLK